MSKIKNNPIDYSKSSSWFVNQKNGRKKVDVIYFMPTTTKVDYKKEIYPVDKFVKDKSFININKIEPIFGDSCNIFIPFTRQISHYVSVQYVKKNIFDKMIDKSIVKQDAFAALDYYFKHINHNKPFILSGLCQGGIVCKLILSQYMKLHPDYYSRMIAAYLPGTCIDKKYLKDNPHIKVAKKDNDLKVLISWNTQGPNAKVKNIFLYDSPYCINPLNWKTNSTYCSIKKNIGSLNWKNKKIIKPVADAQIDLKQHVIITTTAYKKGFKPYPIDKLTILGDQSYHLYEWDFYCVNVKQNIEKRIKTWFKKHSK